MYTDWTGRQTRARTAILIAGHLYPSSALVSVLCFCEEAGGGSTALCRDKRGCTPPADPSICSRSLQVETGYSGCRGELRLITLHNIFCGLDGRIAWTELPVYDTR